VCDWFPLTIFIHFAVFVESRQINTLQLSVLVPDLQREREREREMWLTLSYEVDLLPESPLNKWNCALLTFINQSICSLFPNEIKVTSVLTRDRALGEEKEGVDEDRLTSRHVQYTVSCHVWESVMDIFPILFLSLGNISPHITQQHRTVHKYASWHKPLILKCNALSTRCKISLWCPQSVDRYFFITCWDCHFLRVSCVCPFKG